MPKPPTRKPSIKPTRAEAAAARVYIPRMITANVAAQILKLKGKDPAAAVRTRLCRYRKRMGIKVGRKRPRVVPKFAQLSACGSF